MIRLKAIFNLLINQESNVESKKEVSVSFIGAGNVAHHLALGLKKNNVNVAQIYNRSKISGITLSEKVNAQYISTIKELKASTILIIAVSDKAINGISESIPKEVSAKTIIVHTSGSQSMNVLESHRYYGSFYPLQSFRKELEIDISSVPILISAPEGKVEEELLSLGDLLSQRVTLISDEKRSLLHLPAVMVNNFTNHLFQLAYDYCERNNLDFSLLHPLINETVKRLDSLEPPKKMQTGPAVRGDRSTISRHKEQLESYPEILQLYELMTQSIENYYK